MPANWRLWVQSVFMAWADGINRFTIAYHLHMYECDRRIHTWRHRSPRCNAIVSLWPRHVAKIALVFRVQIAANSGCWMQDTAERGVPRTHTHTHSKDMCLSAVVGQVVIPYQLLDSRRPNATTTTICIRIRLRNESNRFIRACFIFGPSICGICPCATWASWLFSFSLHILCNFFFIFFC